MKSTHIFAAIALLSTAISQPLLAQVTTTPSPTSGPVLLLPDAGLVGADETPTEIDTPQTQLDAVTIIETSSGGIAVESLQQIDPEIFGTLDDGYNGLGFDMWNGTARADIHRLIANLPTHINSAALRDLTRRLLLTTADLKPLPENVSNSPTYTQLRVKKLMQMGLLDDAIALISLANNAGFADLLRADFIEAHLFLNNFSNVCAQVALSKDKLGEAYWQKLLIFCQALAGDLQGAEFGANLMMDMGNNDPTFFTLVEKLIQNSDAKLETMPAPNALHMALAELTKTALPKDVLKTKNPAVLQAIATNNTTPIDIRLAAAERATLIGVMSSAELNGLYKMIDFSPEELNSPISTAKDDNSSRSRALLFQAAAQEAVPEARALIIQEAISLAKQAELYPLAIATHLEHIIQIPTSIDIWWFAGNASRALYAVGRPLPAQAWLGHLRTQALRTADAQTQLIDFWPLAGISAKGLLPATDDGARQAWADSQLANTPDTREAINQITKGYILLDALDQKISDKAWAELAQMAQTNYQRLPNPAISHMMLKSAMAGKRGEAIAWIISLLGELGTSHAGPETIAQAITALRALGLQEEARTIALEAALKGGL